MKNEILKSVAHVLSLWFRHFPYVGMNQFLYRLSERYINWRGFILSTSIPGGAVFSCGLTDIIQKYIYYFGVWEPHITAYILANIKDSDVFVDVGSNIGYYTVVVGKCCNNVVSIEASPSIFEKLQNNIRLNNLNNVRPVNVVVGESRGEVPVFRGDPSNIGGTTTVLARIGRRGSEAFEENMPSLPFDEILKDDEKKKARFIKIDIEGAEYPVLKNIFEHVGDLSEELEIIVEFSSEDCHRHGISPQEFIEKSEATGFFLYQIRNDYRADDYLNRVKPERPRRIKTLPVEQVDLVLSRRNTTHL